MKPKILIIGFGSIGQRHYRNLATLGYESSVYDSDQSKLDAVAKVSDLKPETLRQFNLAFVCTPNSYHLKTALNCTKAGLDLFIEKPLSHSFAGTASLSNATRQKKLVNMVGCNMRFHPCVDFIKKYLQSQKLGKVYSAFLEVGYFLPYWRPNIDYRQNYAVKKSQGGGIVLDATHEFDLLFWLMNDKQLAKFEIYRGHVSRLEMDTEDQAVGVYLWKDGKQGVVAANYLSQSYRRFITITGEKGTLTWNFKENKVYLETKDERRGLFAVSDYDINRMYEEEIKYFLDCVSNRKETQNTVADAALVLKYQLKK